MKMIHKCTYIHKQTNNALASTRKWKLFLMLVLHVVCIVVATSILLLMLFLFLTLTFLMDDVENQQADARARSLARINN